MGKLYVFRLAVTWVWLEKWGKNGRVMTRRNWRPKLNRAKYLVTQWGPTYEEAMEAAVKNTVKSFATDDEQWGGFADVEIDELAYNQHVQYDVAYNL